MIFRLEFPVVRYFRWKLELFSNILKLIVEDFRTLIICFHNVNGIIKRRLARLKAWVLGLIVDHWMFLIAFHYFKNSWYIWKDDNTMNPNKNTTNINFICFNYTMNMLLHNPVERLLSLLLWYYHFNRIEFCNDYVLGFLSPVKFIISGGYEFSERHIFWKT